MKIIHSIAFFLSNTIIVRGYSLRGNLTANLGLQNTTTVDELVAALRVVGDERYCVKPKSFRRNSKLKIRNCGRIDNRRESWILEEVDDYVRFRSKFDGNMCIETAGRLKDGGTVRLRGCDVEDDDQLWVFENGQIHAKRDPDLCMTYRGINLEVGDSIILKNCDYIKNLRNADSKEWSFDGYDDAIPFQSLEEPTKSPTTSPTSSPRCNSTRSPTGKTETETPTIPPTVPPSKSPSGTTKTDTPTTPPTVSPSKSPPGTTETDTPTTPPTDPPSKSPTTSPTITPTNSRSSEIARSGGSDDTGATAGIVVGSVLLVGLAGLLAYICMKRRNSEG